MDNLKIKHLLRLMVVDYLIENIILYLDDIYKLI